VRNLLSGWSAHEDSRLWQPNQTVAELGNECGVKTTMVGHSDYENSGFTQVFMSGADFIAVNDLAQRAEKAHRAASAKKSLVYLYFAELDQAAHRFGVTSSQWLAALEAVDSAVGLLSGPYGLIVTADHGVIDVVPANHIYLDALPGFVEAVTLAVGDPRALYCYGDLVAAKSALTAAGTPCYLATFDELVSKGWVDGSQTIDVVPDFVVIARGDVAFYDRRTAKAQSLKMIGQHGAIDDRETRVPLLFGGAFS
jgi:predicted AlkP superfamily pyrophosphatase or phosphodiesterase